MSKNDDPRVQEAFRLLAEVAKEDEDGLKNVMACWGGWTSTETRRDDYNFEIKVLPKDHKAKERRREVEIEHRRKYPMNYGN
jgi:hypothetical protein